MADFSYDDFPESSRAPLGATVTTIMNWTGAALSLALIAGVAVWGYKLLVRDVTGVPVVRALEGPMRIAPEDPGGEYAPYQGLAVNAIAAEGTAEEPPAQVVLAPPEPTLTDEDRAMAALLPDEPETPLPPVEARQVSATDLAVAEALGEPAEVLLAAAVVEEEAEPQAEAVPDGVALDSEGIVRSPRPQPRPVRVPDTRVASLGDALPEGALGNGLDVDPTTIQPGARLVQLGAYPSVEIAQQEWDLIAGKFGDFLAGKKRVIQPAEAGGRTFYRLRVLGFEDLSDSRRFCAVLVAGEASCIPVSWR